MSRITPAQPTVQIADLGQTPALDLNQARQWLSRQPPASLPLAIAARLHGLTGYRAAQQALLTAAFERAQGSPTLLADLRHMAKVRQFDPDALRSTAPRPARDKLVRHPSSGAQARRTLNKVMAHHPASPRTADSSPAASRTLAATSQLARAQLQQWLRLQESKGCAGAFFADTQQNLQALGALPVAEVAAALRAADARPQLLERLATSTFQAVRDRVIHCLREKLSDEIVVVKSLSADKAQRQRFLAGRAAPALLERDLRAIGIEPQLAARIARRSPQQEALFARGLKQAAAGLAEVATLAARAGVNDKATLELFELCTPLVNDLQVSLTIRPDSFARQAIDRGLARGRAQRTLDKVGQRLSTVASSIVVGVISGGASLAGQALGSLGASAASGLPALSGSAARVRQAAVAEGLGAAQSGTRSEALGQQQRARQTYLTSMINAALFGPAGTLAGTALAEGANEALDLLQPIDRDACEAPTLSPGADRE